MTTPNRQRDPAVMQRSGCAALLLALAIMAGCSDLALPREDAPPAAAEPGDSKLIADYLKSIFKDTAVYNMFEIAGARWFHSSKGWSWLTCVRFQDHGRPRSYSLFLKNGTMIDNRYSVRTDGCDLQTYVPFDLMGAAAAAPAGAGAQGPIY